MNPIPHKKICQYGIGRQQHTSVSFIAEQSIVFGLHKSLDEDIKSKIQKT
jgi:hypothetical protein